MPAASDTLVITTPRRNIWLAMGGCAAGAALGLWVMGRVEGEFWAWSAIGVTLLMLGVPLAAIQLWRPTRLVLSPQGFAVAGGVVQTGLIPWHEVESLFLYSEQTDHEGHGGVAEHAAWRLKPDAASGESLVARLHRSAEMRLDGSVPRNIGRSPAELVDLMETWRARHAPDV